MKVKNVKFTNFKGVKDYSVSFKDVNVLVGPNNAGKSSIIDALRMMSVAIKSASHRNAERIEVGGQFIIGFNIPISKLPISIINVHCDSDYDSEARIDVTFDGRNQLALRFFGGSRCILVANDEFGRPITTAATIRSRYPVSILAFPTLGPLEEQENYLTDDYVEANKHGRRAHRLLRNVWFRQSEKFAEFRDIIEKSWPGITISPPARYGVSPPALEMYFREGRRDREISWAGYGFQVWLQLVTHLVGASSATMIVVDEPEIYLHPDLQRRFFDLLRKTGRQIVLATHSAEIINDAEHDEVLLVNKGRRSAQRIDDVDGLQAALFSIGSAQNIQLTKLSRGRRVLFLEGNEFKLLRRFAGKLGLAALADGADLTVVPIGGFEQRNRIEDAAWTFSKVLRADIKIAALLDRNYRASDEIDSILSKMRLSVPDFYILESKEIENYLIMPTAIAKSIDQRLRQRDPKNEEFSGPSGIDLTKRMLLDLTDSMRHGLSSQLISHKNRYFMNQKIDTSSIVEATLRDIDNNWSDLNYRIRHVSGKHLLAALNQRLSDELHISITPALIVSNIRDADFSKDFREILVNLNQFASAS